MISLQLNHIPHFQYQFIVMISGFFIYQQEEIESNNLEIRLFIIKILLDKKTSIIIIIMEHFTTNSDSETRYHNFYICIDIRNRG